MILHYCYAVKKLNLVKRMCFLLGLETQSLGLELDLGLWSSDFPGTYPRYVNMSVILNTPCNPS